MVHLPPLPFQWQHAEPRGCRCEGNIVTPSLALYAHSLGGDDFAYGTLIASFWVKLKRETQRSPASSNPYL